MRCWRRGVTHWYAFVKKFTETIHSRGSVSSFIVCYFSLQYTGSHERSTLIIHLGLKERCNKGVGVITPF